MRALALFISCFLFITSTYADLLIIEPEMGREPVLGLFNQAQQSIHLSMYGFTDEKIRLALLRKKHEGLDVKVILEKQPYKNERENQTTIAHFKKHHITWHGKPKSVRLMHAKLLLVDQRHALLMTFNFTHSAFKQQRNFALLIDDPEKVKALQTIFYSDWQNHPPQLKYSDIIVSPFNSRQAILDFLLSAEHTIHIYAQNISDPGIIHALIQLAKRGIHIQILTTNKTVSSLSKRLAKHGILVRENTYYYVHAKIIMVDARKALIGSINLTRPSLDDNRELAMVTRDENILKALNNTFTKDWQQEKEIHNRVNWLYDPVARRKAWQMFKNLF